MVEDIKFAVDDAGKKTTTNTSLGRWRDLWKDICDILVSGSRHDEPSVPWETLRNEKGAGESQGTDV
jgi:hypothetical protein